MGLNHNFSICFQVEPKEELPFLQASLVAFLAKQSQDNPSLKDALLFYVSVWHTGRNPKEFPKYSEVDLNLAKSFVNENNVKDVVSRIVSLRRRSSYENLFDEASENHVPILT